MNTRNTPSTRSGTVLLVVVGLTGLMLAMTLALTMKVQSDAQTAAQIRKFGQAYLIAGTVHTRWPRLKTTQNYGNARSVSFIINFWDLAYDHVWDGHTDPNNFISPPTLLGYFLTDWRDVVFDRRVGLCNGGGKSTGYNGMVANSGNINSTTAQVGFGYAYDYTLAFVCDENRNFPPGHHLLTPADATFPRPGLAPPSVSLRTGNQLSAVLAP